MIMGRITSFYALKGGVVRFRAKKQPSFTGKMKKRTVIDVV